MAKFRRQFSKDYPGQLALGKGEVNNEPSMTVPDQAIPLQKLLENHTRPILMENLHREGEYFDGPVPDIQDLNDLQELREENAQRAQEIKGVVEQELSELEKGQETQDPVLDNNDGGSSDIDTPVD